MLTVPTVRDRTVQGALRNVIEPIFEREFAQHSYGFRPGRGCKDALREVDRLLKEGYVYVVDADLRRYFDTIPQDRLVERVKERIADGQILKLVESFLKQGLMDGLESWTSQEGTPQGAVMTWYWGVSISMPAPEELSRGAGWGGSSGGVTGGALRRTCRRTPTESDRL